MYNIIEKENVFIGYNYDLLVYFKDVLDNCNKDNPTILKLINELRNDYEGILEVRFDYDYDYTITKFTKEDN